MIICALCDCVRPHQARGLCNACYFRAWTCDMIQKFTLAPGQFLPDDHDDGFTEIGRIGGVVFYRKRAIQ